MTVLTTGNKDKLKEKLEARPWPTAFIHEFDINRLLFNELTLHRDAAALPNPQTINIRFDHCSQKTQCDHERLTRLAP